ncbi:leucine-rich repeat domain-containing protein [Treponema socranskii]|uniref:leucine-rich repeat domain-containing protein n=1 Tax=Treponema socranskii TaxID=53419 RepID=UPI003D910797
MTKRKDTKAKAFTCRGAAALITAALLTAAVLLTGCPQSPENQTQNPSVPPAEQKVTLTVAKGEHVQKTEPASLTVDKGSAWSAVKGNITVTYEAGWEAAGWKFDSAAGSDISDTTVFNENKTVVVLAKAQGAPAPEKITITVTGGEHVTVHTENTFTADKGAVWQDIRSGAEALVTYETGWENEGWKFDDAAGIDVNDAAVFNENKTVFASAKPLVNPNLRIEGGVLKGYNETPSGALVIPAGVTEIAGSAFSGCTSLTQVNFPASLTKIGSYVFSGCTGLTSLSLPASLETLNDYAFYGCTEITGTVTLPANLKTIGTSAFSDCNKVDAFDFTQCTQLTFIDSSAFSRCTKITAVNLPASLETIAGNAFSGCTALATLTVDAASTHLSSQDNIVYDSGKTKLLCRAPNVTQVTFPVTLTEIAGSAFSGCTSLTQVNFPASLTKIGSYAFSGCTGLTSLSLPASLETLNDYAFYGCTEITGTVTLPANLKTIGTSAFSKCNKVDAFDFTQCTQLTEISYMAFAGCKEDAIFTVKAGGNIKNHLLNSQSGINASQITEVP